MRQFGHGVCMHVNELRSSLTCMSTDDKLATKSSGCKLGIGWDCNWDLTESMFGILKFGYPSVTHQNLRNNSTLHLCHDRVDHGRCKSLGCWNAPWTCPSFLGQPVRMCKTQSTSRSRSHHIQCRAQQSL